MGVKDALIVTALSVFPRKRGARTMGWLARSRASRALTRGFVRAYGLDMAEAEGSLEDYATLEQLFTRALKPEVRPIEAEPRALVSPVDGRCAALGRTREGCLALTEGKQLDVASLLGEDLSEEVDVAVLYLSPRDYHRVHVPREGRAVRWRYTPGTLWPVFPAALRRVRDLFSQNERMAVRIQTDRGLVDVVLIGAFGVGRISLQLCGLISNTRQPAAEGTLEAEVSRGQHLGTFHLGSTVILITPPGRWQWSVLPGDVVRMGRAIALGTAAIEERA